MQKLLPMCNGDIDKVYDLIDSLTTREIGIIKQTNDDNHIRKIIFEVESDVSDTAKSLEMDG